MVGLLGLLLAIGVARADEPPDPGQGESGYKCASTAPIGEIPVAVVAVAALARRHRAKAR
jgi:hypothetical protein